MKRAAVAILAVLALAIGGFAVFNGYFYPPMGLHGLTQDQYERAFDIAARGFCSSSGLDFEKADFIKFRKPETGDEAYAWGVARCRTGDGRDRLAWIYLEWSYKRRLWTRSYTLVLADDDDEAYYTPAFPGQVRRATTALAKIMKENARHVREWMAAGTRQNP